MARRFSLNNPDYEIPIIGHLELEWAGAAHQELARQIGFQDQFRQLFKHLYQNLQSVPSDNPEWIPRPLSLSVRAGAVKTYVLLTVSIAEGALAALGEERGLGKKKGELYGRMFGGLLSAWELDGAPHNDVIGIWEHLQLLKKYRNYIHLNKAAQDEGSSWQDIVENEERIINACDVVIDTLRNMCHVFREEP